MLAEDDVEDDEEDDEDEMAEASPCGLGATAVGRMCSLPGQATF